VLHENSLERRNEPAVILRQHLSVLLDFWCRATGNAELGLLHVELIGLKVDLGNFTVCKLGGVGNP